MYFDAVLVVDESQDIVTRNRVTAMSELVLSDIVVGDIDRFLTVEVFGNHKEFLLCGILFLLLFATSEERYESSPTFYSTWIVLAVQFVEVFFSQQYSLLSQCLKQFLAVSHFMERSEFVDGSSGILYLVFGQEGIEYFFALFLHLSAITSEYGLYLSSCLSSRYKVDPRRLYVL